MGLYGLAAASGPAIAPVVSGYAVVANGWRWAYWEMLWLSGFSLLLLGFTMPEVCPFLPFFISFQSSFLPIIAVLESGCEERLADNRPHPQISSTDEQSD